MNGLLKYVRRIHGHFSGWVLLVTVIVSLIGRCPNSHSQEFEIVGSWPGFPRGSPQGVIIADKHAYVACGSQPLLILDIGTPSAPRVVGAFSGTGYCRNVVGRIPYVYLAQSDTGVRAIDVSVPTAPQQAGFYASPGKAYKLFLNDTRLFFADGTNGLVILDVSVPSSLQRIGQYRNPTATRYDTRAVFAVDNTAYVVSDVDRTSTLEILDVGNAGSISRKSSISLAATSSEIDAPSDIKVDRGYAFVALKGNGLSVVDVADSQAPTILTRYTDLGFYPYDVVATNGFVFAASGPRGLRVLDARNPSNLTKVGAFDTGFSSGWGIEVRGDVCLLADFNAGVALFDVSDMTAPRLEGLCEAAGRTIEVEASDGYAFVADSLQGLQVLDAQRIPDFPRKSHILVGGNVTDVKCHGPTAFVLDTSWVRAIDVSNPNSPTIISSQQTAHYPYRLHMAGNQAFITEWTVQLAVTNRMLEIVDFSDVTSPVVLGAYRGNRRPRGVFAEDGLCFITEDETTLEILNVVDPRFPFRVGSYSGTGRGNSVVVRDGIAFVAAGMEGLLILDVHNPSNPVHVGSYDTATFTALDVDINGHYAVVADGLGGLALFDIVDVSTPRKVGVFKGIPECNTVTIVPPDIYVGADRHGAFVVRAAWLMPPSLQIQRPSPGLISLSWNGPPGSVVQTSGSLDLITDWQVVAGTLDQNSVTLPAESGAAFFRLYAP